VGLALRQPFFIGETTMKYLPEILTAVGCLVGGWYFAFHIYPNFAPVPELDSLDFVIRHIDPPSTIRE
jgi:hypothetical protein